MNETAGPSKKFRVHFCRMEFSILEVSAADADQVYRSAFGREKEAAIDFTTERAQFRVDSLQPIDPNDKTKGQHWVAVQRKFPR